MLGTIGSMMEDVGPEDGMVLILRELVDFLDKSEDCWGFQVACLEVAVRIGEPSLQRSRPLDEKTRRSTCG